MDRNDQPRCVVFSDIRGDFRLLSTLLSQITKVAEMDAKTRKWRWLATNTVVVCLGNYTNRFEPDSVNRHILTTETAIADEQRILDVFSQLEAPNDMKNAVVVLAGNHELSNLIDLPGYEYCQMADPQDINDRESRKEFADKSLRPFIQRHGILAGWGGVGGTVYFSHGSINRKWMKRMQVVSIQDLNRKWSLWIDKFQTNRLVQMADSDSPLMSSYMAVKPQLWREEDFEYVVQLLGDDPNPRFVISTMIPIQRMQFETFDTNLKLPTFDSGRAEQGTMLAYRNSDGIDDIYLINNAMADTFCIYEDVDRQPQALEFHLAMSSTREVLYLSVEPLVMQLDEYRVYLNEIPYYMCKPDEELKRIPVELIPSLTPEELIAMRPSLWDGTTNIVNAGMSHVEYVGIVIFSHDMSHLLLIRNGDEWTIPFGRRESEANESDWNALLRVIRVSTGIDNISFEKRGTVTDFEGSTRIWFKRSLQSLHSTEVSELKWVSLDKVLEQPMVRHVKTMLCVFSRNELIPRLPGFEDKCPSWLKIDNINRVRRKPWWISSAP
jgi:hypothetical protein